MGRPPPRLLVEGTTSCLNHGENDGKDRNDPRLSVSSHRLLLRARAERPLHLPRALRMRPPLCVRQRLRLLE